MTDDKLSQQWSLRNPNGTKKENIRMGEGARTTNKTIIKQGNHSKNDLERLVIITGGFKLANLSVGKPFITGCPFRVIRKHCR